ncbi:hypothetical protein CEP88_12000 [Roseobacter denitrificans]|nr:hypothetical protein CEP88_12000 [Roseobacter denitrificans]
MSDVKIPDHLRQRHRQVRAGFIVQGTSLQEWCRSAGVKRQNADKALLGQWQGEKASNLVQRILAAATSIE